MSLALHLAYQFIQHELHSLAHTHLSVRIHKSSFIIYSIESDQIANRAILTPFPGNEYVLSIASPRGRWQLIPYAGQLSEQMSILTGKLAFSLTRWH
ncbi:hypothetical protein D7Z26_19565 [Cohnella endophytica]|uniref:Uncharacterized protein n=1 Tax=Cohnella endophytica TaxID=2419778 RepID=A0A494XMU3_9BACL|nr:hypothetical protein [Cohnella endophytica]RKP50016.1 hypothetical protein D7Z26_19565 [Cohnella endophytica]